MGRYKSKSRSYSPSPPPPRRRSSSRSLPPRRKRYDDPRDRYRSTRSSSYRDYRSSGPTGLLVRNISLHARSEDLRIPFERFGPVKDVYLPKNYYTGEPRGFGFVKFHNAEDAAEAKERMNHHVIGGREIRIVFAEENRKTPQEMRTTTSGVRYGGGYRRRSPLRSPRRRRRSYSRSASPARRYSRSPSRTRRYSPSPSPSRRYSRSPSPSGRYARSPLPSRRYSRSPSPPRGVAGSPSPPRGVSGSPSPLRGASGLPSPPRRDSRSRSLHMRVSQSHSPPRHNSRSPLPVRRVSRSPSLARHDSRSRSLSPVRERDRGARPDYRSSQRFTSKSPSPNGEKEYMSDRRSPSPRENGRRPLRSHSYSPRK